MDIAAPGSSSRSLLPWAWHLIQGSGQGRGAKIGLPEGVSGLDPLARVVLDKLLEQVDCLVARVGHDGLQGDRLRVGERDLGEIGQRPDPRPDLLVGRAQDLDHDAELVDVVLAGEDGRVIEHLAEDAAHRPEIDGLCILPGAVQQFRSPIFVLRDFTSF